MLLVFCPGFGPGILMGKNKPRTESGVVCDALEADFDVELFRERLSIFVFQEDSE